MKPNVNFGYGNTGFSSSSGIPVNTSSYGVGYSQPVNIVNREVSSSSYYQGGAASPVNNVLTRNSAVSGAPANFMYTGIQNTSQYREIKTSAQAPAPIQVKTNTYQKTSNLVQEKPANLSGICFGLLGVFALVGLILGILFGCGVIGSNRSDIVKVPASHDFELGISVFDTDNHMSHLRFYHKA